MTAAAQIEVQRAGSITSVNQTPLCESEKSLSIETPRSVLYSMKTRVQQQNKGTMVAAASDSAFHPG